MPLIGSELIPNDEERKILEGLELAWGIYQAATRNMESLNRAATSVLFPMVGRNEHREATVTIRGRRFRLIKDGEVVRMQELG